VDPMIATQTLPIRERKYCCDRDEAEFMMMTIWTS
jgi:hypothetical protein